MSQPANIEQTPSTNQQPIAARTQTNPNSLANLIKGTEGIIEEQAKHKDIFLAILPDHWPNIAKAAKQIGIDRRTAFYWRTKDPTFADKWDEIEQAKIDELEKHIVAFSLERGGAGYIFPILKAYRREKWGDQLTHGGTITQVSLVSGVRRDLSKDELSQVEVAQDGIRAATYEDV